MPRHAFSFHPEVQRAVRQHVRQAVSQVDPRRYKQEPAYVTAIAQRLEGVAYEGQHGKVEIQSTIVSDRGPKSAESIFGADLAITAEISDNQRSIRKAILVQAKRGSIDSLPNGKKDDLIKQLEKMRRVTYAPKVMEIDETGSGRLPQIISGRRILEGRTPTRYPLDDYFVRRILTTLDGSTARSFVNAVQDSDLTALHVIAKT